MHENDGVVGSIINWAVRASELILRDGRPLTESEIELAVRCGVRYPEKIRIRFFNVIHLPDEARSVPPYILGMQDEQIVGLSLGYGIAMKKRILLRRKVLEHELRHTAQCERYGSLEKYIREYLLNLSYAGYHGSPLEEEARGEVTEISQVDAHEPDEEPARNSQRPTRSDYMDIHSPKGTTVKFFDNGTTAFYDRWPGYTNPKGLLVPGGTYTIHHTEVHSDHTKVFLEEVEGEFNSVWFLRGDA